MPTLNIPAVNHNAPSEFQQQFVRDIQVAIKKWTNIDAALSLRHWHTFRVALADCDVLSRQEVNKLLIAAIEHLKVEEPRTAEILTQRFLQDEPVQPVANRLNLDPSRVQFLQAEGLQKVSSSLWRTEEGKLAAHRQQWLPRFDLPTSDHLVGIKTSSETLYQRLSVVQPPWIVAIEGIGGIGKTALASELFRRLLDYSEYRAYGWVSAKQSYFNLGGGITPTQRPALSCEGLVDALLQQVEGAMERFAALSAQQRQAILHQRFKRDPHFVVIDNLETANDIDELLPLLERWSNPTRFLLTSRVRYEADSGIHHITVPPLSEADALCLVRSEAKARQTDAISEASDDDLRLIYRVVGGNPLALRLVVGLSHAQGLALVLEDLRKARGSKIEALYTYIYKKAWESLDRAAQTTWLAMPLIHSRCATLDAIAGAMEDLEDCPDIHQVRYALDRLVQLNLVDVEGALNERCYSIHQLTRTFLQEQVAKWMV